MSRRGTDIFIPKETGALVFGLDTTGTIVSVFDKAVNIRILDRQLVSIVRDDEAMTPMSIHCPALFELNASLRKYRSVDFKGGVMAGRYWCMALNRSKRFEGLPEAERRFGMDTDWIDRFEKILHFTGQKDGLLGITREDEPRNVFVRRGRKIAAKMLSADSGTLAPLLAGFTGLGPGFTPSGDDLICGFLMGAAMDRHFTDGASGLPSILDQEAGAVLRKAADRTCDAGRTLIRMALAGRFPRFLCQVAAELSRAKKTEEMLAVATKATRYGHSSGTDALLGLLLYLKTHQSEPQCCLKKIAK